jgi:hypothetical protein
MIRHHAKSMNHEIVLCGCAEQSSDNPMPNSLVQKNGPSFGRTQGKKKQLLADIPRGSEPNSLARQCHAARLTQPNALCVAPGFSPALFAAVVVLMRRGVGVVLAGTDAAKRLWNVAPGFSPALLAAVVVPMRRGVGVVLAGTDAAKGYGT